MAADKLVETLGGIAPQTGGVGLKVLVEFGDRPEVLDAIIAARGRRCSYRQIATALSQNGVSISAPAVQAFLASRGVA